MYEILAVVFSIILLFSIFGILKYGFNMVFFYIGLFCLVLIIWTVVAIIEEKKRQNNG